MGKAHGKRFRKNVSVCGKCRQVIPGRPLWEDVKRLGSNEVYKRIYMGKTYGEECTKPAFVTLLHSHHNTLVYLDKMVMCEDHWLEFCQDMTHAYYEKIASKERNYVGVDFAKSDTITTVTMRDIKTSDDIDQYYKPVAYRIETKDGKTRYLCYSHMLEWPVDDMRYTRTYQVSKDNDIACYTCKQRYMEMRYGPVVDTTGVIPFTERQKETDRDSIERKVGNQNKVSNYDGTCHTESVIDSDAFDYMDAILLATLSNLHVEAIEKVDREADEFRNGLSMFIDRLLRGRLNT